MIHEPHNPAKVISALIRERDEAREQVRSLTERLNEATDRATREALARDKMRAAFETSSTDEENRLRAEVRSLTIERDAAREEAAWMKSERDKWRDFKPVTADLVDRLSRAREALAGCLEARDCAIEFNRLAPNEHRLNDALAALRAALAEPPG